MAYQTRSRTPLLDINLQEAIRRRGTELIGLALLAASVTFGALLWTYTPKDPSWLSATSDPVQNILGSYGAAIASPLMLSIGWAAWCIPVLFGVWGMRFVFHISNVGLIGRITAIPVFTAFSAVFMATQVPFFASWQHEFGLGGILGDAVLGIIMDLVPLELPTSLNIVTVSVALLFLLSGLFALGFSKKEVSYISRCSLISLIRTYFMLVKILVFIVMCVWRCTGAILTLFFGIRKLRRERAEMNALHKLAKSQSPEQSGVQSTAGVRDADVRPAGSRQGFWPRIPILGRTRATDNTALDEARVHERINDAIQSKSLRSKSAFGAGQTGKPVGAKKIPGDQQGGLGKDGTQIPQLGGVSRHFEDEALQNKLAQSSAQAAAQSAVKAALIRATLKEADSKPVVQPRNQSKAKPSKKAKAEAQPGLFRKKSANYKTPPLELLANTTNAVREHLSEDALAENARMLESVLDDYGVKGRILSVRPGPVVTMYELEPAPGLKASRVIGLADDIARSMSALSARVSTVPGRTVIGIELPNATRETVLLREILSSRDFGDGEQNLPLALGKDIGGTSSVANLAKMPHLLIAGTTGSGKSVAINVMILSLVYRLSPEECRMIMIDPKMLELSVYDGIPHLLSPVVTDPKKAVVALKWAVGEMEERYRKMSKMGVRNIGGYNARVEAALEKGEDFTRTVQTGFDDATGDPVFETEAFMPEKMPFIVVIVDEMADLMMVAGKEIEACIQRLAQMARASGIHLVMATQRPSVDVITGTIKANFPTRISFQVTSKIDSRTILGEMGAEQLLGMGDMLYMAGGGKITRFHAPFVSDEEVEEVVNHLKANGAPEYIADVVEGPPDGKGSDIDLVLGLGGNTNGEDALYDQAVAIVLKDRKCSTSYIQRKLFIGYNKAAKLVEQMEEQGVVSQANHVGKRDILVPEQRQSAI